MRTRYVYDKDTRELVEVQKCAPTPVVMVIHDTLNESLLHHGDGKLYESKRAFRAATRACGLEEVGDQVPAMHRMAAESRRDNARKESERISECTRRAIQMHEQGYRPVPLPRCWDARDILGGRR